MNLPETLRSRREFLGFSLKAVSDDLQFPLKYLSALESGDWERLPPRIYARGFLKKYALYLDLAPDAVLVLFDEALQGDFPALAPETHLVRQPWRNAFRQGAVQFLNRQRFLSFAIGVAIISVGVYFAYEFRYAIRPPTLILESPAGDMATGEDSLPLVGRIEKDAEFRLNGRQIFADEAGVFHDMVLLRKGLNTLVFAATNRFGNIRTITRYVVVY